MAQDITRYICDTKALLAVGSNLATAIGEPSRIVSLALKDIETPAVRVEASSRLFATPCMPAGAGPDYVNAAVLVTTALGPAALMAHLHEIEARYDRRRERRWGARSLDLDLLDHGGAILPDPETWHRWHDLPPDRQMREAPEDLVLPHPRIQDRGFVLVPLADVAPGWVHPVLGRSVTEMLARLDSAEREAIRPIDAPNSLAQSANGR